MGRAVVELRSEELSELPFHYDYGVHFTHRNKCRRLMFVMRIFNDI